jgi:DNA-binding transcriptional MerR regulator
MPAIAPATIAELARKSGVDVASIRLYERIGLLPKPRRRRSRSGDAAYHQEHLDRLLFVRRALDLGFSLADVAELAGLSGGLQTCGDIYQIVERHRANLKQRIDELTQREGALKALADACAKKGGRSDCAILAELFRSSEC